MLLEQGEKIVIENTMTDPKIIAIFLGIVLIIIFAEYMIEMYICSKTKRELKVIKDELLKEWRKGRK